MMDRSGRVEECKTRVNLGLSAADAGEPTRRHGSRTLHFVRSRVPRRYLFRDGRADED